MTKYLTVAAIAVFMTVQAMNTIANMVTNNKLDQIDSRLARIEQAINQ